MPVFNAAETSMKDPFDKNMSQSETSSKKKSDKNPLRKKPEQIIEERNFLKGERTLYDQQWQEIYDYMIPRKADVTTSHAPGQKRGVYLYDNTAMQCAEILAGIMHGMLTSPNERFFGLQTGVAAIDENDLARAWFDDSVVRMHNVLNNTNFQTEVHELYLDLVTIGTSLMTMLEDDESVIRFSTKPIRSIAIKENNKGLVDCIYLWWEWDARTLAQEYGEENLPDKIRECLYKNDTTKYEVIQCIYPMNLNKTPDAVGFKYYSQHILVCDKKELKTGFFKEFPAVVPRWSKIAGEKYGYGPGTKALPEAKTINLMTETMIIGAQKTIDPPIMAPDDGVIFPLNTMPGGISYYRSIGGVNPPTIKPIFNDMRIDYGFELMNSHRMRIREAFYVDQLQLAQGPAMTATEVMQRTEERMRLLGPMLGRMQSEFLKPLVDRLFEIMINRGMFLPAPEILKGKKVEVLYTSPIAKAQALTEARALQNSMALIAPLGAIQPTVYDNYNFDEIARGVGKIYGVPQKFYNNKDQRDEVRKQREQAQAQAMQQAQAQQEAETLGKLAPAMKQSQGA